MSSNSKNCFFVWYNIVRQGVGWKGGVIIWPGVYPFVVVHVG